MGGFSAPTTVSSSCRRYGVTKLCAITTHELALDVAILLQHPVRDARDVAFDGHPVRLGVARQRRFVHHEAHHDRIERVQDGTLARHVVLAPRTATAMYGHNENAV